MRVQGIIVINEEFHDYIVTFIHCVNYENPVTYANYYKLLGPEHYAARFNRRDLIFLPGLNESTLL